MPEHEHQRFMKRRHSIRYRGARMTSVSTQTGETRQTNSSAEGYFTFVDLPRGEYTLTVTADGFRGLRTGSLILTVGQQMTVRPKLEVGTVSETVEVDGTPPPVVTSSSSVSQLVDSRRIEQLPLMGAMHCNWSRRARHGNWPGEPLLETSFGASKYS